MLYFLSAQEETKLFKVRLKNIEEIIAEQNYCLNELNYSKVNINDKIEPCKLEAIKDRISSFLITPKLKRSVSYQINTDNSCCESNQNIHQIKNNVEYKNNGFQHYLEENCNCNKECCIERNLANEHTHYEQNYSNTDDCKPRLNTKSIIQSLRLNLSDIESMTANNILRITALKS